MRSSIRFTLLAAIAVLFFAPATIAAPPAVPASLPYQGLLLDGLGAPRTGSVDLTVRVFDAVIGGTLVYKQSFPAVSLADGVFSVQLGPVGESSDAPANPLTTDLATALGGDAGATSPSRFLEVTVGSDGATMRTQILSSAYALRATSAATADTATTAQTANDVATVDGVDSAFVSQLFQYFSADGSNPPNDDPSEGLVDTDGDGRANFIDSDNDNDGLDDGTEVATGSDINLVSPRLTSITPTELYFSFTDTVEVHGSGFQPGLAVSFGSQTPAPTSLTPWSFQVQVGPQSAGFADVTVTNPNGQSHHFENVFEFTNAFPDHSISLGSNRTTLAVRPGTIEVVLGGIQEYGVGLGALSAFPFASAGSIGQIGMTFDPSGKVAGLRCRDNVTSCDVEIRVDSDGDDDLADESAIVVEPAIGGGTATLMAADLATDPAGRWVAGYVRRIFGPDAVVSHDRNGDGDFADGNERVTIDSGLGNSAAVPADLAIDGAGRVAYVYFRQIGTTIRVAYDRSGDGDYSDTVGGNPEFAILTTQTPSCLGATFDGDGHLVVVYGNSATNGGTTLARDDNGDGDFADAGESVVIWSGSATTACDVAYSPGQPLAVLYNTGSTSLHLALDKNDDGDFTDSTEDQLLNANSGALAALTLNGVDRALVSTTSSIVIDATD